MKTRMLIAMQLSPVVLSLFLLAAHFLRAGIIPLALLLIFFPLGLLIRKAIVPRLFQVVLILGAIEWVRTGWVAVTIREQYGQPWTRLAVILGVVAGITLASTMVFFSATLKNRYQRLHT